MAVPSPRTRGGKAALELASRRRTMSMSHHPANRRGRQLTPVLEPIEGRILLSGFAGAYLTHRASLIAEAARTRRLALNGRLAGQFAYQTPDGQNFQVTITAQGNSGNRR